MGAFRFQPNRVLRACLGLALVLTCASATEARAWPPLFGPEFTFTNDKIRKGDYGPNAERVESPENAEARDRMAQFLREACGKRSGTPDDCVLIEGKDKKGPKNWRVQYQDGFWFDISVDQQVVEIQAKPSTSAEFTALKDRLQRDIFDAAKHTGITPDIFASGGHIHIGTESAFGEDLNLLRNFVADFGNHPELGMGILELNQMNAPPLAMHGEEVRQAFQQLLEITDYGVVKSIRQFAEMLDDAVYDRSFCRFRPPEKYQALCLMHTTAADDPAHATVEVRSVRTQRSMEEFLLEIRLFEARIDYLKKITADGKLVRYLGLGGPMSDQALLEGFYRYVVESGLSWQEYKALLPTALQKKKIPFPVELGAPLVDPPSAEKCARFFQALAEYKRGIRR